MNNHCLNYAAELSVSEAASDDADSADAASDDADSADAASDVADSADAASDDTEALELLEESLDTTTDADVLL